MQFFKSLNKILLEFLTFFGATAIWLIKRWGSGRESFKRFVWDRQLTHPIWFQVIVGAIFLTAIIWLLSWIF
jgi:hypothetical protein